MGVGKFCPNSKCPDKSSSGLSRVDCIWVLRFKIKVAESQPDKIFKSAIDIATGLTKQQAQQMAANLNFTGEKAVIAAEQLQKLYQLFRKLDCTQLEINPFAETPDGRG